MHPLLFKNGLQLGKPAHTPVEHIALFIVWNPQAVRIEMAVTVGIVFVDKPWLKEVVLLANDYRAGVGGAVIGCP